jgi:hypothetical protein
MMVRVKRKEQRAKSEERKTARGADASEKQFSSPRANRENGEWKNGTLENGILQG